MDKKLVVQLEVGEKMLEDTKNVYNHACALINASFFCETPRALFEVPNHPVSQTFAEYESTITQGNTEIRQYNFRDLMLTSFDVSKDCQNFFMRDFLTQIAESFRYSDLLTMKRLFQYFVHDGDNIPNSLKEIRVADLPSTLKSEEAWVNHPQESEIYFNPTMPFLKKYPVYKDLKSSVSIQNSPVPIYFQYPGFDFLDTIYPQAAIESEISLADILKNDNFSPIFRHVIKLWIIHILISEVPLVELKKDPFFNCPNLEEELLAIQNKILSKIQALLVKPKEEMRAIAKKHVDADTKGLSQLDFRLAQRIPLLRVIFGHADYNVHELKGGSLPYRIKFYIKSFLNVYAWKYLFNLSQNIWQKSKEQAEQVMNGEASFSLVKSTYWHFLKANLLLLWLPFISVYFSACTLTSLPFVYMRKLFGIKFGNKADRILSAGEVIKDALLWLMAFPLFYLGFNAIGSACLGAAGLEIGSYIISGILMACWSPVLLALVGTLSDKYPGWVRRTYNERPAYFYREKSEFAANMDGIRSLASFTFARIHAFVLGSAFVAFTLWLLTGFAYNKFSKYFSFIFKGQDLRRQAQNLNHTQKFREFLAKFATKVDESTLDKEDKADMTFLAQCILGEPAKKQLKEFLQRKLEDEVTPEKGTLRIALQYIDNECYLPSKKLVSRVKSELSNAENSALKKSLDKVDAVYQNQLKNHL